MNIDKIKGIDMSTLIGLDVGKPILPNKSSTEEVIEFMRQKMIEAELLKEE